MKDLEDTICALSTPPGRSGLAVVRVSGSQAFSLVRRIFLANKTLEALPVRRAMLGRIVDPGNGSEIDEAIATCYRSPHSYTGEDLCEFSIHGSPVLVSALLDCLCALNARLAEPGEFTMRAFLHGRIDLTQAEAVRDIIDATTLYQAQVAARQRAGLLSQQMGPVKKRLIDVIVNLESAVEFAEQDLPVASRESIVQQPGKIGGNCKIGSIPTGKAGSSEMVSASPSLAGRMTGKSSLFNVLLAQTAL